MADSLHQQAVFLWVFRPEAYGTLNVHVLCFTLWKLGVPMASIILTHRNNLLNITMATFTVNPVQSFDVTQLSNRPGRPLSLVALTDGQWLCSNLFQVASA